MMLLKLGPVLLMDLSRSEVANPGCNLYWHFWFRSSLVCSLTASTSPCSHRWWAGIPHRFSVVTAASTTKATEGQMKTWHLPCSPASSQRFQEQNLGPEASLPFARREETQQRLCQNQLLPAVSCCQTLPVLPQGDVCSLPAKLRSLDRIHVFLMRGLENLIVPGLGFSIKHSYSLQLSGFPRRDVGG